MTFDEYQRRPVYRAQVHTFNVLKGMLGLSGDVATPTDHPVMLFRLLPQYRTPASLALRKLVANKVRQQRRGQA